MDLRGSQVGNTLLMTGNASAAAAVGAAGGEFASEGGNLLLNTIFNTGVPLGGAGNSFSDVLIVDRTSLAGAATGINVMGRSGPGGETPGNGIMVVEVRDATASAADAFVLNGDYVDGGQQRIVGGAFTYGLFQHGVGGDAADGNWYLRQVGLSPNAPIYEDTPAILDPLIAFPMLSERGGSRCWLGRDRDEADTQADPDKHYFNCALIDEDAVHQFGGNQLFYGGSDWVQISGMRGVYSPELVTRGSGYDMNHFSLQAGKDFAISETDNGIVLGGVSLRYGSVSGTSGLGSLSAHGLGFGGSLTYYDDSGLYADGQASVMLISRDYNSALLGGLAHGALGLGYGLSVETGYRAKLSDNWTLTPQLQLSYTNLHMSTLTDRFGAVVSVVDGQSLRGRLGLGAEYQDNWKEEDGTTSRFQMHAVANLYNEFLPDNRVSLSGFTLDSRKHAQWAGLSVGANYNWNDDSYSLYGELSANTAIADFGNSYELKGTVGLRVKW